MRKIEVSEFYFNKSWVYADMREYRVLSRQLDFLSVVLLCFNPHQCQIDFICYILNIYYI